MELYKNNFIQLDLEQEDVYITVRKKGQTLFSLNDILQTFPRINITNFMLLKEVLHKAENQKFLIGTYRPLVEFRLAKNKMKAIIFLHCTKEELHDNKEAIIKEIKELLRKHHVTFGILQQVLQENLQMKKEIVIAKGIEPVDGVDAQIHYRKLKERRPTIKEDGKADFYDMNFIEEIQTGEQLAEKIAATEGEPGMTVTGESIPERKGKDKKFMYDPHSVGEFIEGTRHVLRALRNGALERKNGRISVGKHLLIDGDVGVETGNIEFDGSITIKGIVQESYSVTATGDISILGDFGISKVKQIVSEKGDIFIKGGIFGQGSSLVKAGKSIFVKHANDCLLEAGEDIHIGTYSIGSRLKAANIITDDKNGKLIGGIIQAKGKVKAAIIGNSLQRKTTVHIEGFNRIESEKQLAEILRSYKKNLQEIDALKNQLDQLELKSQQEKNVDTYNMAMKKFEDLLTDTSCLEEKRVSLCKLLQTKGEGQVTIEKIAFPDTYIRIKKSNKLLQTSVQGTFYVIKNELFFE
ncbi:DUF342 domain-containing protein [Bacillaceae bacterium Marseille-Q3522]|nr:DUF342 domain-containing protein [Bacillaceae bacterium Marseille-Q3522]